MVPAPGWRVVGWRCHDRGVPRLFVAVLPPVEVVDDLTPLERADAPGVRWTPPEQWHVTLHFLGDAPLPDATAALGALTAAPCTAVLGPRVGRLGREVLMLPVGGLDELAAAVGRAFAGIGRPPDPRPFLGHLTLARLRARAACGLVDAAVRASWPVGEVHLVESTLGADGSRYEVRATRRLTATR
jgi:2'-5' RNA ligase